MATGRNNLKVIICGAGVIGSSIAYFLTEKGITPIIVERCGVACGASGKSGGFLASTWCDQSKLKSLARKSFELHYQLSQTLGVDYGYRRVDTLSVSIDEPHNTKKTDTLPPSWVDGPVIANEMIGDTSNTAQVHPYKYTHALLNAAKKKGASLIIGEVKGIEFVDETKSKVKGVIVDEKVVPADVVVIAMGPWSYRAKEWFDIPKIEALKAHSIVMTPKEPISAHALFLENHNQKKAADPEVEVYPRPDGDVYMCGISEKIEVPGDPANVVPTEGACDKIKAVAGKLSSKLAVANVHTRQACFLPMSPDDVPLIGKLPNVEGAYIATGHSCWGILNSSGTGAAMAELIADGVSTIVDLQPFDPNRFQANEED